MSTDGESLICPITQEVFRDPVIAEDGRLYEREAITRWITENGTSPFTRQILDVNCLLADDEVRRRADLRRKLSVSYSRESDQVHLPPIRSPDTIYITERATTTTLPPQPTRQTIHQENMTWSTCVLACIFFPCILCYLCLKRKRREVEYRF